MFQNYLKIAIRHISRNKGYVFINVMGLGIALACSIVAFVNWQAGVNADRQHKNVDNIFRVLVNGKGYPQPTADIAMPLATRAAANISGIVAGVRLDGTRVVIQHGDDVYHQRLSLADPNFLEVFDFELLDGEANDLYDPSKIFLSNKQAKKYFGEEQAVGKTLVINPEHSTAKTFIVGGVLADIPAQSSSIKIDFLTHIDFLEKGPRRDTLTQWKRRVGTTFLLLKDAAKSQEVTEQLAQYIPLQNKARPKNKRDKYLLEPMNTIFMGKRGVSNTQLGKVGEPAFYWAPALLALLILLTACLNFTNTTISFSNKRLKEMGVRKVMGVGRKELMLQLLGESFLVCLLATCVGIVLVEYLMPLYNQMWDVMELELTADYFNNPALLLFIGGMLILSTLLGGGYAAFYISSFKPSAIFRGNTKFGGDNWLVRGLLGLQIVISLIAIIGGVTFAQNAIFQKDYDLGYNRSEIINVELYGERVFNKFKNIIQENKDIQGIAGTRSNIGFDTWDNYVGKPEDNRYVNYFPIGDNLLEVMDLEILTGRAFDRNLETDYQESVLVTQKFVEESNWQNPIGKKVKHAHEPEKRVIGVVADFYASSLIRNRKPEAGVFHFVPPTHYRVMKVRVASDKLLETQKYLKGKWAANFPLIPFTSYFQDEAVAMSDMVSRNTAYIYIFLAIITILLAATGLFSLVSLNLLKRAKEIAVRRVLGASAENITYTVNKHYFFVFLISGLIGALIGGWFSDFLIDKLFAVYQGVSIHIIIVSVISIFIIGALTIGGKLFAILRTNPAETLKSE